MALQQVAVIWLAALLGAYVLLFWIATWWARRTPNDVDDVVVAVLRWPVVLSLLLWAIIDLSERSALLPEVVTIVQKGAAVLLVGVATWGIWRLVRDTVLYYGQQLAQRTEANFDDVLFPVLRVLAPVIIVVTGAILMLRLLGADFSTIVVTAGGAALFLGLALGDTLKNILGGVMLLIDTPFRFGDLIVYEGAVCQIRQIGLRVTMLYNTESHADVYVANSVLAVTNLTNLTRPSPDLRVRIDLPIPAAALLPGGREALLELAQANPYVLGNVPAKLGAMKRALAAAEAGSARARELEWGLRTLGLELALDEHLAEIDRMLAVVLETIRRAERGGLSREELAGVAGQVSLVDAYDEKLKAAMREWAAVRSEDPQLGAHNEDRERLLSDAEARIGSLGRRLESVRKHLARPDLYHSQRFDDMIVALREWLPRSFKQITPAWKCPLVQANHTKEEGTKLHLFVYIDDIHLEGFVRQQRVTGELFIEGMARLQSAQQQGS